ncbi:hypothetical protein SUGI_0472780 [Cryptomeria japonica]|nr:hypothetical protein SUGI_0472780 [Cryptomeria japonica]
MSIKISTKLFSWCLYEMADQVTLPQQFCRLFSWCLYEMEDQVVMTDFFMANQLTSQVTLLRHLEFIACYYIGGSFRIIVCEEMDGRRRCKSSCKYKKVCVCHICSWCKAIICYSYYDSFNQQREQQDQHVNLALIKLEIVEKEKHVLPSDFRCQNKWISVGTTYRRLVS